MFSSRFSEENRLGNAAVRGWFCTGFGDRSELDEKGMAVVGGGAKLGGQGERRGEEWRGVRGTAGDLQGVRSERTTGD